MCLAAAMALGTSAIARAAAYAKLQRAACCTACIYSPSTDDTDCGGHLRTESTFEGIDFNGDGTPFSPFATVSINGTIIIGPGTIGTYTVAADCTGTLSISGGAIFDMNVGPGCKQIWMIQTGPPAAPAGLRGNGDKGAVAKALRPLRFGASPIMGLGVSHSAKPVSANAHVARALVSALAGTFVLS